MAAASNSGSPRTIARLGRRDRGDAALARRQLHDRDHPPGLRRLLAVARVLGEDTVGELPQTLALGLVLDDLGPKRQTAVDDVGMLAQVVVPGRMMRPSALGRDDRDPLAVVEVERGVPARPTGARTARLEQRRGERTGGAEATARQLQQVRVELPGDVDREPRAQLRGREPGHGQIQATPPLVRVDVSQVRRAGHGWRDRMRP